jgi:hypothetical protein
MIRLRFFCPGLKARFPSARCRGLNLAGSRCTQCAGSAGERFRVELPQADVVAQLGFGELPAFDALCEDATDRAATGPLRRIDDVFCRSDPGELPHGAPVALLDAFMPGLRTGAVDEGTRITLAARPGKGRHRLNMYGKRRVGRNSAKSARSGREPWLLASGAGVQHLTATAIVALCARRMRIEQSFRDTKNLRAGMGLEVARSRSAARLQMLLLVAHLPMFVQRLIGEAARTAQLEMSLSATRNRRYAEISVLTLGRRIPDVAPEHLKRLRPWRALGLLNQQARAALAPT